MATWFNFLLIMISFPVTSVSVKKEKPVETTTEVKAVLPQPNPAVPTLSASKVPFVSDRGLRAYLSDSVKKGVVPGVSIAIHRGHELISEYHNGLTAQSTIPIASLTKSFTAVAIMQLVENDLIHLDDPVSMHLEGFKIQYTSGRSITIRDLLQHTSGIPYEGRTKSIDAGVKGFQLSIPTPIRPAGERHEYSNPNYHILSAIIERKTGMGYGDYMRKHILEPLEMKNTYVMNNFRGGASGIGSTVEDLSHFAEMILHQGRYKGKIVLSPEYIAELFVMPEYVSYHDRVDYYALGFHVTTNRGKIESVFHTGLWNGCLSEMRIFPQKNAYVVQLANPVNYKMKGLPEYRGTVTDLASRIIFSLP